MPAPTPERGPGRLARIVLIAGAPLLLACGVHLLGGGTLPIGGVVLGLAVMLLIASTLTGRRCRFWLLLPLLGVEQLGLHVLLTAAAAPAWCPPGSPLPVGHHLLGPAVDLAAAACHGPHRATGGGWLMFAAHALATLATAWMLARGEAWWWRTLGALAICLRRPTRRRARAIVVMAPDDDRADRLVRAAASPRGPPALIS